MGGRGRGRGRGVPNLGLPCDPAGMEQLPPMLQPPLTFPPLEYKPYPMNITAEMRYMLNVKKDFAETLQESPNNVMPVVIKKDIERYCDRYQDLLSTKQRYEKRYDWSRMPAELKPQTKKRKADEGKTPAKKKLKDKDIDIETKLKELEKKENTHESDAEEHEKGEDEEKDPDDPVEGEEEEIDEEMDEGTDYVNNYFDNGENFEDDEENLDDGAIF